MVSPPALNVGDLVRCRDSVYLSMPGALAEVLKKSHRMSDGNFGGCLYPLSVDNVDSREHEHPSNQHNEEVSPRRGSWWYHKEDWRKEPKDPTFN